MSIEQFPREVTLHAAVESVRTGEPVPTDQGDPERLHFLLGERQRLEKIIGTGIISRFMHSADVQKLAAVNHEIGAIELRLQAALQQIDGNALNGPDRTPPAAQPSLSQGKKERY